MLPTFPLWAVALCLVGPSDEPPRPTFDKKVDYVAWYNDYVSAGRTKNAFDMYAYMYDATGKGKSGLKSPEGKAAEQFEAAFGHVWEPEKNAELVEFLGAQEPFLRIAKKAAGVRDFWIPCPTDSPAPSLLSMLIPLLSVNRGSCKDFIVLSWMKQEQQGRAMLDAWRTVLCSAGQMQQGGPFICMLVGLAERALTYAQIRCALAASVLNERELAAAVDLLRTTDPRTPNVRRAITVEWAVMMDTLQYVCPQGKLDAKRWGDLVRGVEQAQGSAASQPADLSTASFDPHETADQIDTIFREMIKEVGDSPSRAALHKLIQSEEQQAERRIRRNNYLRIMIPSLARGRALFLRAETDRRATVLLLGIHQYHAKHGNWPEKLDQVNLADLASVRIDPYSDADFKYALLHGTPKLYSVGANEKDDGGRHDSKWGEAGGDQVFWPPPNDKK